MPDKILRGELDRLQEERGALKEREEELETQCAELEARIQAIRDRVSSNAETAEPKPE
jgi:predicted  nucleic acid-binding Zn-ribbon protein